MNHQTGLALGGAWNETSEPTPAGGQPDYFEVTVTPDPGYSMSTAVFSLLMRRNDQSSKNSLAVYYDDDPGAGGNNFATKILTGVSTSEDVFDKYEVIVEGLPDFTNKTTPLTFRVYAWGTMGTGTMRLDNIRVQGVQETVTESKYAYYGDAARLVHPLDAQGNRIPDFSSVGYMYGNEPIPDVTTTIDTSRVVNVAPVAGDDMASIQTAIDQVGAMAPDANGFRGIVQLSAGLFEISDQLLILDSGVILRGVGDGDNPSDSTILQATGTHQRSVIIAGASSGFVTPVSGTTHNIIDKYLPVGASSVLVDSTANWNVDDEVVVFRPSTAEWITAIGMDNIPPRSDGNPITQWAPGGNFDQPYERVITRIEGNRIFLNAPVTNSFEQQYGGGTVFKYTFPRINRVGIENIRGVSDFASDTDENHARTFIEFQAVEHAWARNVTGQHFIYATTHASARSRMITVDDAVSLAPKSIVTGGRRYPFVIDGQFTLMKNLFSEDGRHDFVNNSAWRNRGPNVFLNGTAVNSNSSFGPHQRWSTGTLYDTITSDNQGEARNRGNFGSGHGWGGANFVFWNNVADSFIVQNPQTAQNWIIGSTGTLLNETRFGPQPPPSVDAHDTPVDFNDPANPTSSLFVAQHNQRTEVTTHQRREYVLGDYDLVEYDGSTSADAVFVDAQWQLDVDDEAFGQPVSEFDVAVDGQYVPGTFEFDLAPREAVVAATLSLGLRGTGGDTTDDLLFIDDIDDFRSFSSLGLAASLSTTDTTVLTIELTGSELFALQDGQLNLLVSENTSVDWATLDITVDQEFARLDVDDSAATDALTDGLLVLRHLFGFTGNALSDNATQQTANRNDSAEISEYLGMTQSMLDADGSGSADALTDGLLTLRHLFGFTGAALIDNAISQDANRTTAAEVSAFLDLFLLPPPPPPELPSTGPLPPSLTFHESPAAETEPEIEAVDSVIVRAKETVAAANADSHQEAGRNRGLGFESTNHDAVFAELNPLSGELLSIEPLISFPPDML